MNDEGTYVGGGFSSLSKTSNLTMAITMTMTIKKVERKKKGGKSTKMKNLLNKETAAGANFDRNQQTKAVFLLYNT